MVHTFFAPLLLVLLAGSQGAAAVEPDGRRANVDLVCEQTELVPGTTASLGLHFRLQPHWHVYWNGRSDAGGPIDLTLDPVAGYEFGTALWPAPKRMVSPGDILDHVYEDEVTIIIPVKVPQSASGKATFSGKVKYVICSSACVMEDASVKLTVPVAAPGSKSSDSKQAGLFKLTRARLPQPLPTGDGSPTVKRDGTKVLINAPGASGLTFFPGNDSPMFTDITSSGHAERSSLAIQLEPDADMKAPVEGVLEVRAAGAPPRWYQINVPSLPTSQPAAKPVDAHPAVPPGH